MLFLIVDDVDQVKNSFSDDFLDSKEKNLIRNLISSFTLKEKKKISLDRVYSSIWYKIYRISWLLGGNVAFLSLFSFSVELKFDPCKKPAGMEVLIQTCQISMSETKKRKLCPGSIGLCSPNDLFAWFPEN